MYVLYTIFTKIVHLYLPNWIELRKCVGYLFRRNFLISVLLSLESWISPKPILDPNRSDSLLQFSWKTKIDVLHLKDINSVGTGQRTQMRQVLSRTLLGCRSMGETRFHFVSHPRNMFFFRPKKSFKNIGGTLGGKKKS